MKKILIDLQCLQTESANRGIGRYAYNLTLHMLKQGDGFDFHILLNSALPNANDVKQKFAEFIKEQNFHIFTPVTPCYVIEPNNWHNMEVSEFMYEAFVAQINPDLLFLPNLMEGGLHDSLVVSISKYFSITTMVVGYDLIPLHYEQHYLANEIVRKHYFNKLQHKSNANVVLGISEFVTKDISRYLNHQKCINISSAVGDFFSRVDYSNDNVNEIKYKYAIKSKYVMYTGGIDFRKNIEGLIKQFSLLPRDILDEYSLVIVCKISESDKDRLFKLANSYKIHSNLVITGFVNDEDLRILYSLCSLFVFPSLDEGFGLPVLEAMQCGAVVCCSNNSSLPEVVGFNDVLFDVSQDFYQVIYQLLVDDNIRHKFLEHSKNYITKFSWSRTALVTLNEINDITLQNHKIVQKKSLAMVSPFPVEQSGIADYSMELIQALSKHYVITLVTDENVLFDGNDYFKAIDYRSFEQCYDQFDRVVYQMGNSHFHSKMYSIMNHCPGVVVLHDFYIAHFINHYYQENSFSYAELVKKAINDHGYDVLQHLDSYEFLNRFPLNRDIIKNSFGVIVHSNYSVNLFKSYYPIIDSGMVKCIPQLRKLDYTNTLCAKDNDVFTIVSMGGITSHKCIAQIIDAIIIVRDKLESKFQLLFVGDKGDPTYFDLLSGKVKSSGLSRHIKFTDRIDSDKYTNYLINADIAIQLRINSNGETSRAVLDCMSYGIPVIVNNHGSLQDLPDDVVYKIPEFFTVQELADSICDIVNNKSRMSELATKSVNYVENSLCPNNIAELYKCTIEDFYLKIPNFKDVLRISSFNVEPLQATLAFNKNFDIPLHQVIYVDISELVKKDWQSGIQRVVKIILNELLKFKQFKIQPVYFLDGKCYHAYNYMVKVFAENHLSILDACDTEISHFVNNAIFIGLDLHYGYVQDKDMFDWLVVQKSRGTKFIQIIYDLILIHHPQFFPKFDLFERYVGMVRNLFDGVVCISKAVANDYINYVSKQSYSNSQKVGYFHLGCDIENYNSHHSSNKLDDLSILDNKKFMLMVSTVEPRKGHAQVLEAFEGIWAKGCDYCLVIVGKQGWDVEELIKRINNHPQLNRKIFWLQGVNDQTLTEVYKKATAFIMASYAEGFGLGIVESAKYHKPLILRDIPVFREIAEDSAYYFDCDTGKDLAGKLVEWIQLYESGLAPSSVNLNTITWEESCTQLMDVILNNKWYKILNNE